MQPPTEEACSFAGIPLAEANAARKLSSLLVIINPFFWGTLYPRGTAEENLKAFVMASGSFMLHRLPPILDCRHSVQIQKIPQLHGGFDQIFGPEEVRLFGALDRQSKAVFDEALALNSNPQRALVIANASQEKEVLAAPPKATRELPSKRAQGLDRKYFLLGCWSRTEGYDGRRAVYNMFKADRWMGR